jgi:hypothetical protein
MIATWSQKEFEESYVLADNVEEGVFDELAPHQKEL